MNINASIIDQRVTGIVEDHPEWLPEGSDLDKKKAVAFVLLCISTCLEIPMEAMMPVLMVSMSARWRIKVDPSR